MAQLVRASGCQPEDQGFNSLYHRTQKQTKMKTEQEIKDRIQDLERALNDENQNDKIPETKKAWITQVLILKWVLGLSCIILCMSCSKQHEPQPDKPLTVTYTVDCTYCLVYIEDEEWNRNNHVEGRPDAVSQHFNVAGHWSYTFYVIKLDTASIRVYAPTFSKYQYVSAKITTSTGKSANLCLKIGVDNMEQFIQLEIR